MLTASMPSKAAIALRSIALFFILYQFKLLAGDLSDTIVFIVTVVFAFVFSIILFKKNVVSVSAIIILVLIPIVTKLLLMLPGFFISEPAPFFDSLVINFERNTFVTIIPFYWFSITSFFCFRSIKILKADVVASFVLLIVIYSIAKTETIALFRLSVLKITVFASITIFLFISLLLSIEKMYKMRKKETVAGMITIVLLSGLTSVFLLGPSQDKAVNQGGGLLQPEFLKFDFSQILKLETEINLTDDLILIVKKSPDDYHVLLRRYILSGYSDNAGFYLQEGFDDKEHPVTLPNKPMTIDAETNVGSSEVNQEFFLVNFDSSAFVAMKQPVQITPYQNWDASSFNSAYAVNSSAGDFYSFEIMDSVDEYPDRERLGLSQEEFDLYTQFGNHQRIEEYAKELTSSTENYWEKIQLIYEHLKYGDYRYSFKPGIAPDGDQLSYFLFDAKKGYCSYFAFSFALMLRSIGIPARVAVGFFIDPELGALDYYPVRSDMAHAWVEVRFPGYGWIEYDPTTQLLAEGEEFRFDNGTNPDGFEQLIKEILQNRSSLTVKDLEEEETNSLISRFSKNAQKILQHYWMIILAAIMILINVFVRAGNYLLSFLFRNPRKKSYLLWKHVLQRMKLIGCGKSKHISESDWAKSVDTLYQCGMYNLYLQYSASRFAETYSLLQHEEFLNAYKNFSITYCKRISVWQRIVTWLFPWMVLCIYSAKKSKISFILFVLCSFFLLIQSDHLTAEEKIVYADSILGEAFAAEEAENWDRAAALYIQGAEEFPNDYRFSYSLGALYFEKRLYQLAWEEYRKTEKIIPYDTALLYNLAWTASYLNDDEHAALYFERLLHLEPENIFAIGDLAWIYFKLYRLEDGINLLNNAIEQFGNNYGFSMTMGTLYSEMLQYEEAKKWYLDAIALSDENNNASFLSVATYNISVLEFRFYQFANAMDRANESLRWADRPSGKLSRGELYLRQLDFAKAFADFQDAYTVDDTSLSKINMARAYQIAGRLEEARLYAEDILSSNDFSWMASFGINPDRHKKDVYEVLYESYKGLKAQEDFYVSGTLKEYLQSIARKIIFSFKAEVNKHLFQKYSLISAKNYADAGQNLEALLYYYDAVEEHTFQAEKYLSEAKEIESMIIPESLPSYLAEEAMLFKQIEKLPAIIETLDAVWERDLIADSYETIAENHSRKNRTVSYDAAERLFALNRGALRQNGISLPVNLSIVDDDPSRNNLKHKITAYINKAGFNTHVLGIQSYLPRYHLILIPAENYISVRLEDVNRGTSIVNKNIELTSSSSMDIINFVRNVSDLVFSVN